MFCDEKQIMTEDFSYEVLFKFVFPNWKDSIPPLPQFSTQTTNQQNFLSDDEQVTDFYENEDKANSLKNELTGQTNINNIVSSQEIDLERNDSRQIEIDGFVIWEICTENFTNLTTTQYNDSYHDEPITKIRIHTQNGEHLTDMLCENQSFSENCIHFLPNSCWIYSIDPQFQSHIKFFDPILATWLCNTESLAKSEIIVSLELFDKNLYLLTSKSDDSFLNRLFAIFISIYNNLSHNEPLFDWLNNIEFPHMKILGLMHQHTLYIDAPRIINAKANLSEHLAKLEEEICQIAGCEFNILSPYEVSDVLFNRLQLIPPDSNQQKGYSIDSRHRITVHREFASTNSVALEKVNHPIAKKIVEYRKLQKLSSNWLSFDAFSDSDGGLHPQFLVCSTATGRISTKSPNLLSIPSSSENGLNIRSFFIPNNPQKEQYTLISLDYSQLELRILAHFSQDQRLCELCRRSGIDVHRHLAQIIFSVDSINAVTSSQRDEVKQSVYATIYGKGWTKDGREKGQKLEAVLNTFPKIRSFATETTVNATKQGYVETLSTKRRILPNIKSGTPAEKKRDQRMSINTKIQGSAADFVKFALLQIMEMCGDEIEPLLQIHDEWLFRTKLVPNTDSFNELCHKLQLSAECADKMGISVPIPCKISIGPSYGELIPFTSSH